MAQYLYNLKEIAAILDSIGCNAKTLDRFREQAERATAGRPALGDERCEVSSGFGQTTKRGFVAMRLGGVEQQLEPKKAIEIAGMLHAVAEAAISDELVMKLLDRIGVKDDPQMRAQLLLELRELRQGSRGVVYPT